MESVDAIPLELIPVMIFAKDLQGRYQYASEMMFEFWEADPKEILGKADQEIWRGAQIQHSEEYVRNDQKNAQNRKIIDRDP